MTNEKKTGKTEKHREAYKQKKIKKEMKKISRSQILKLTKSPQTSRCQLKRRLPLKEYSVFIRHQSVKFEI
jgi:hypothetical protein